MATTIREAPLERRPYQGDGIAAILDARARGVRSVMVVMPTGTGKTLTMAETAREFGVETGKVVAGFIAHRHELIMQAEKAFRRQMPDAKLGFEHGGRQAAARTDVFFGSIQSLRDERLEDVISRFEYRLGLLVIDEAHRSAAESYRDVHSIIRRRCPDAMIVGFTATPDRTDGVGLADLYDEVVYSYDAADAISDGWLVPVAAYRVESDVSVDAVKSRDGDFVQRALGAVVNNEERNRRVVHAYQEVAMGKRAIAFCAGIGHAVSQAEALSDAGVPAVAVHGSQPPAERRRLIKEYELGQYLVLCGADLFIEGFDVPGIECVIMSRPTESSIIYRQSLGRGLRPHEEIARELGRLRSREERLAAIAASTKPQCIVIDVADVSAEKSIKSAPRLLGVPYRRVPKDPPIPVEVELPEPPGEMDVEERLREVLRPTIPVRLVEIDLMQAEEQLASAMTKATYRWMSFGAGVRRMELPDQPVGTTQDGMRIDGFAAALMTARNAGADDVVAAATAAVRAASVRWVPVWAELHSAAGAWSLAIYEGSADHVGVVVEATEPALAPALRRVEALLRARYPLAIPEIADMRTKAPSRRMATKLSERGLEVPATRGEAIDMLGLMYASPLEKSGVRGEFAPVGEELRDQYADLLERDDVIGEIARVCANGWIDALSVQQPWCVAILRATKRIENRVWKSNARGWKLLHAAKTYDHGTEGTIHLSAPNVSFAEMRRGPRSALVGAWKMDGCVANSAAGDRDRWARTEGNGFLIADKVVEFEVAIPYRGAQRFFKVPGAIVLPALRSAVIRSARAIDESMQTGVGRAV